LRRLELTLAAEADLAAIFDHSTEAFGAQARARYERLAALALKQLRENPLRLGSLDRPELGLGIRTYHLRNSRGRGGPRAIVVRRPRHLIAYVFDDQTVLVLRILHESMDLARHLLIDEDRGWDLIG
jgi:toxin ParE1/3/4